MITFREVNEKDFNKLYFWLNTPHVKKFWDPNDNFTFEQISEKYSKRLKEGKIEIYIFSINNIDIGFIQTYIVDDLSSFKIKGTAKGIDLYIGEEKYLYKGYGKEIIREFLRKFVFNDNTIKYAVIDPEQRNISAIKAYKKAGFEHSNTAYNEIEKAICYYMVLSRDKFFCNY